MKLEEDGDPPDRFCVSVWHLSQVAQSPFELFITRFTYCADSDHAQRLSQMRCSEDGALVIFAADTYRLVCDRDAWEWDEFRSFDRNATWHALLADVSKDEYVGDVCPKYLDVRLTLRELQEMRGCWVFKIRGCVRIDNMAVRVSERMVFIHPSLTWHVGKRYMQEQRWAEGRHKVAARSSNSRHKVAIRTPQGRPLKGRQKVATRPLQS